MMLATPNSAGRQPGVKMFWLRQIGGSASTRLSKQLCLIISLFLVVQNQLMAGDGGVEASGLANARKAFDAAGVGYRADTNNAGAAWKFGRACFDLAQLMTNNAERAQIAEQGIASCRGAVAREPALAAGHYYLGMNLGQLADTKRNLVALRMVKEMEREFEAASDLDARFDYAGPDRNLGLLYHEAPALVSIGSRAKARQHLRRAVQLAPDYPENRLNLIEACLKWGDLTAARRETQLLQKLWPEARRDLADPSWAASWRDWESRLKAVKRKIEPPPKPAP